VIPRYYGVVSGGRARANELVATPLEGQVSLVDRNPGFLCTRFWDVGDVQAAKLTKR
jgi:hypothetical protein